MFTWTNLLVVVAELDGGENEALDLVPLVTNVVLEVDWISSDFFHVGRNNPLPSHTFFQEHQLIVGIVVIADPGTVPINSRQGVFNREKRKLTKPISIFFSRGEKQRMHLRDGFLADQLDPIYVAYNM